MAELVSLGDLESHAQRRELVDVGAALLTRKDRHVNILGQFLVGGENHCPAWAADGLVGGKSCHVGQTHGVGVDAGDRHPSGVRDIGHQVSAHIVGDGTESRPVGRPGVGRIASDDHFRTVLTGQIADTVIVQSLRLGAHTVGDHFVSLAGDVELGAVGQVAALEKVQPHQRVSRLHQCPVDGQVGR